MHECLLVYFNITKWLVSPCMSILRCMQGLVNKRYTNISVPFESEKAITEINEAHSLLCSVDPHLIN